MTLLPADLATRYEPARLLGEGGFGKVVLARDRELDRPVAVKLLHAALEEESLRARFEREARVTAQLSHPHVVGVYSHGFAAGGVPFIVYEYVEGVTLDAYLMVRGSPDGEGVLRWARELAGALELAHERGVVHRDLKPGNVLVRDRDGGVVLCDFGLARSSRRGTVQTEEGLLLGSPPYMAPELWCGEEPSPASDQFAWGATLVAALGGESVYGGETPAEILPRLAGYLPPPTPAGCPAELGRVLTRTLAPEPRERFPGMAEVLAALADGGPAPPPRTAETVSMAGPPPVAARATSVIAPAPGAPAPPRACRTPFVLGGLALVVAGAVAWVARRGPPPPAPPPPPPAAIADAAGDADAEAWEGLLAARGQLLRHLGRADHPTPWTPVIPNIEAWSLIEPLSDSIMPLKWKRYLDSLRTWIRRVSPRGSPDAAARQAAQADDAIGLGEAILACYGKLWEQMLIRAGLGALEANEFAQRAGETFGEIQELTNPLIRTSDELGGTARALHLVMEVRLGRLSRLVRTEDAVREILALPLDALPPAADGFLLDPVVNVFGGEEGMRPSSCGLAREARQAVEARLARHPPAPRAAFRCRLASGFVHLELVRQLGCEQRFTDPGAFLAALEGYRPCIEAATTRRELEAYESALDTEDSRLTLLGLRAGDLLAPHDALVDELEDLVEERLRTVTP